MKKCYFIGMSEIFDAEIIDTLKEKCEKIIEAEDLVEFWFFTGRTSLIPDLASALPHG